MKVLLTGHLGYIGAVASGVLTEAGHEVTGLDSGLYDGCDLGPPPPAIPELRKDVRDVVASDLHGFDGILHLAAVSNDPVGQLDPDTTYAINHRASVHLARMAREAGVPRFVFSSSCSLYGAAGDDILDEGATFDPVTAYGESKVLAERDIAALADDAFSPVYLRNATVYGASPRLRGDVVVNNLTGVALTTGEIHMKSDGTPWRPLVHVRDVVRVMQAALEAPRDVVHNEAINVGRTEENYRISEVADIVREELPGTVITFAEDAGPDLRCYRVSCEKLARLLPDAVPQLTVRDGVRELAAAFREHGLAPGDIEGERFTRLMRIRRLIDEGVIDTSLSRVAATR